MSFKEQFLTKKFNEEELLKGYVNNLGYEEYIYYVACLSEYFYNKRKYEQSLYFYDHLVKSIGSSIILRKYEQTGNKVPNEYKKYQVDFDDFTNSKDAEKLGKKIDKIAAKHTSKRFAFQMIMIVAGVIVGGTLYLLEVKDNISIMVGLIVAAVIPLFYRPKPITIDKGVNISKNLACVTRYNKDVIEFIKNKVNKNKKFKEMKNQ